MPDIMGGQRNEAEVISYLKEKGIAEVFLGIGLTGDPSIYILGRAGSRLLPLERIGSVRQAVPSLESNLRNGSPASHKEPKLNGVLFEMVTEKTGIDIRRGVVDVIISRSDRAERIPGWRTTPPVSVESLEQMVKTKNGTPAKAIA